MRTKAAVLWGKAQPWSVEAIELDDPLPGEIQVRLAASGLCRSDEHVVEGTVKPAYYPMIGGHEGAGIVTKVGDGVDSIAEGDHVVLSFIPSCGRCPSCVHGDQQLCDRGADLLTGKTIANGRPRARVRGQDAIQYAMLGTFCPYVTTHESAAVVVEPHLPLDVMALLGCGVSTGWGSSVNVAKVAPGDTVVVIGTGGIGINAVQGAAVSGARYLIAVDPVELKRETALKLGATHAVPATAEARTLIKELTWGRLADKVIIAVSVASGQVLNEALGLTGKSGHVVLTSVGGGKQQVPIDLDALTLLEKNIHGAIFGGDSPRRQIPRLAGLYERGILKLDELITRRYPLEGINDGYADLRAGRNIRGVIEFTEADF